MLWRSTFKVAVTVFTLFCAGAATAVYAQQPRRLSGYQERKREANESVVTIMGSGTASPYTLFAEDIQNVVDEPDIPGGIRVLPILGRGGAQSALDVLLLKGVDMGVIEQDDVNAARKKEPVIFANVEQRLQYITKLSNSEFQVLAKKDIHTLKDLEGKKIGCFKKLSSTGLACDKIFKLLGLNIQPLHIDQEEASAKLRSGEIDAFARYAGAPHGAFKGFKAEDGLHFVPIDAQTVPPEKFTELIKNYSPALLKNEYYPQLIPRDKPVPTIAGSTLLIVYNWPAGTERYDRVAKFVNRFFDNISKFQGPGRQPKWKEINIAYEVPGWIRFGPAQQWLDAHKEAETVASNVAFDDFLKARNRSGEAITKEQRTALFAEFMNWWKNQKSAERTAPLNAIANPGSPNAPFQAFQDCEFCPVMIPVRGGAFLMGSAADPSEEPMHQVTIGPFALSRFPVTGAEWRQCVLAKACSDEPMGEDNTPVRNVSWDDALGYVAWLSKITHQKYRLPTEAEWEFAARAQSKTKYWWGDTLKRGMANCADCGGPHSDASPATLGSFPANALGFYGMVGSVKQWVSDCWHANYHGAPGDGSSWEAPDCRQRVLRGASWLSPAIDLRSSNREYYDVSVRYPTHGFRVARPVVNSN